MAKTKHIIYSTLDDNFENYKKWYLEEEHEEISDEEIYDSWNTWGEMCYLDVLADLDIETNDIIVIADLGLWDGRHDGYKDLGCNIKNCLDSFDCDEFELYVDGYKNLRGGYHHHDGTNYILFREFKDEITDEQKNNFKYKIVTGQLESTDITKYTKKLGDRIGKVYGW